MAYTLLLADDSTTIQRIVELTFASEDIDVVAFSDGDHAIAALDRTVPDIVLADVGMPGRSGYEVASYIKNSPPLAHIPVLLLTGAFEPVDQAKALEAGCDGILIKPFEPQFVISRVKELLRKPKPGVKQDEVEQYFEELDQAFANLGANPTEDQLGTPAVAAVQTAADTAHVAAAPAPRAAEAAAVVPFVVDATSHVSLAVEPATDRAVAVASASGPIMPVGVVGVSPATDVPPTATTVTSHAPANDVPPPVAPVEIPIAAAASAAVKAVVPTVVLAVAPPPSLTDAFTALLAAERTGDGNGRPPLAVTSNAQATASDELLERVTRQVLAQTSDAILRQTVTEIVQATAERLVREEIERIKSNIK